MMKRKLEKLLGAAKEKPLALLLAAAAVILLLPSGGADGETEPAAVTAGAEQELSYSVEREEERLRSVLEAMDGVGRARVLLSVGSTPTRELALSDGEAVVVSAGSGKQEAVEEGYSYPEYLGAVVVCSGAGDAAVRLRVLDAVSAFTGLGASDIQVLEMKE